MKPVLRKPVLVLYHGPNCPDGFAAAWTIWKALGASADYQAVNYGQEPPMVTDPLEMALWRQLVILVDFTYPRSILDRLAIAAKSVEIYDHHASAEKDLRGWSHGRVVFDMNRSGAGIAWDEFHQQRLRPLLISYVEDRDLWRWALPNSREVNEYIFSWPQDFETWDRLHADLSTNVGIVTAVEAGRVLLRAKRVRIEAICRNSQWMKLSEQMIPIVNTAWDFSDIAEFLLEKFPGTQAAGYYFDRNDKRRQWGLRSRGDVDVSALCERYGGGGHRNAAGFTSSIGWLPPDTDTPG